MKSIEYPYFYGASPEIFERAKSLRANMTPAETALWKRLRNKQLNDIKFHRQHPISKFIVDFYCHKKLLVIELDGDIHKNTIVAERDEGREHELKRLGLKILRFSNDSVLNDMEEVIKTIRENIAE